MNNKKPGMYLLILWLWLLSILYFDFKLLALLVGPEGLIAKISVICFVACLNMFWFYGIYHVIVPIYSRAIRRSSLRVSETISSNHPRVAILYTTKNDFQQDAIESCLRQDYPNFHVFICDDSTERRFIKQIDLFRDKHKSKITVARRKTNRGFKAGNINHALTEIQNDYPYFAISDADGILPSNFIAGLMPYLEEHKSLAFVQATQRSRPEQKTQFAKNLCCNTDIHWNYYVPAKEKYGFTMFYGHGAIIRTSVWQELGGLPEIATEDLSFSMKVREHGYHGKLVPEIVCYEEFPSTYERFRRRNEKWVKGTTESLFKNYPGFLFNPRISWVEKLDVFVSAFSLLIGIPFALFLLVVSVTLPLFYNLFKFSGPLILTPVYVASSWTTYLMSIRYNVFWTWGLLWIMVLMIFGPQFAPVLSLWRKPKRMFSYMATSTFLYLSVIVASNIGLLIYLFTGKAYFHVTGEEKESGRPKFYFLRSNGRFVAMLELCTGIALLVYTIHNTNIWLLSVALSLIIAPLIKHRYWNIKLARQILYLPFIITAIIVVLITCSLMGV